MLTFGPLNLFEKKINDAHQYNVFTCPLHAQSMHNKTQKKILQHQDVFGHQ
jgi:hypothetical protein